jgi:hypothetical protein
MNRRPLCAKGATHRLGRSIVSAVAHDNSYQHFTR